ncbi:hypothetical protein BHE97_14195 [Aeromicrobium sp. PE09-221]|nr:hypothetical protein BHE97_14195 [Aeromicrobium sp. PE09-221]
MVGLLTRPSRQGRAAILLPSVAFTVTTAILLTVVSGTLMFMRDDRPGDDFAPGYMVLSLAALLFLAVPTVSLGASAARLSARRRDDRLATLRLLGASTREVSAFTVIEATMIAAAGNLAGIVLFGVLLPLVAQLRFFGERIGVAALWPGWPVLVLVPCAVTVLAGLSAVLGLRRVRLTPLGVRQRTDPQRRSLRRTATGIAVLAALVLVLSQIGMFTAVLGTAVVITIVLGTFGAGLAVLNLVGPPVIAARGRALARKASTPARFLAGRQLADHPAPVWRRVSGLAMISFVAVIGGVGLAMAGQLDENDAMADQVIFAADMRTGVLLTLAIAFVMLSCSVAVTQAAAVLDDAELIIALDRLGMPVSTWERARRTTVLLPMRWAALGGAAGGFLLGLPLMGAAVVLTPTAFLVVAVTFAAGFALVRLALTSTRPVVTVVRRAPDRVF